MLDRDILLAKAGTVERCLRRVSDVVGGDPTRLEDFMVADVVVLNLQRATQACIDAANHVVAEQGLGLPATQRETFSLLEQAGVLDSELAGRLRAMVGLRNVAVHAYVDIDLAVLRAIVATHLDDLRRFCGVVLSL